MKTTLDLPEIPGFEYTGEYRPAANNEFFLTDKGKVSRWSYRHPTPNSHPILRENTAISLAE